MYRINIVINSENTLGFNDPSFLSSFTQALELIIDFQGVDETNIT